MYPVILSGQWAIILLRTLFLAGHASRVEMGTVGLKVWSDILEVSSLSIRVRVLRNDGEIVAPRAPHLPIRDLQGELLGVIGAIRELPANNAVPPPSNGALDSEEFSVDLSDAVVRDHKSLDQILEGVARPTIKAALRHVRGRRGQAAEHIRILRSRLYRRLESLGIVWGVSENPSAKATVRPGSNTARACDEMPVGRVFHADNLEAMKRWPDGGVHFVYLDPPYFSGKQRAQKGCQPAYSDVWNGGVEEYLGFLEPRLNRAWTLLGNTGALCLHLDWHAVHHGRVLLDRLCTPENFLNEIIWSYRTGGTSRRWLPRKHDTLLVYAREPGRHTFHPLREGEYRTDGLNRDEQGRPYKSTRKGRLYFHAEGPQITDVWDIPFLSTVSQERTGYPTQKPLALMRRLLEVFTNPGDVVADPFCGSGSMLFAASQMQRQWIGCDSQEQAVRITRKRLRPVEEGTRRASTK